jgi:hypothetical protein
MPIMIKMWLLRCRFDGPTGSGLPG